MVRATHIDGCLISVGYEVRPTQYYSYSNTVTTSNLVIHTSLILSRLQAAPEADGSKLS